MHMALTNEPDWILKRPSKSTLTSSLITKIPLEWIARCSCNKDSQWLVDDRIIGITNVSHSPEQIIIPLRAAHDANSENYDLDDGPSSPTVYTVDDSSIPSCSSYDSLGSIGQTYPESHPASTLSDPLFSPLSMLDQPIGSLARSDLPVMAHVVGSGNHDLDDDPSAPVEHFVDDSSIPPCSGYDSLSTEQTYLESYPASSASDPIFLPISPLDLPIGPPVQIDHCTVGLTFSKNIFGVAVIKDYLGMINVKASSKAKTIRDMYQSLRSQSGV